MAHELGVNNEEGSSLVQSDTDRLISWEQANHIHVSTAKCKEIYPGAKTVGCTHAMGDSALGSSD